MSTKNRKSPPVNTSNAAPKSDAIMSLDIPQGMCAEAGAVARPGEKMGETLLRLLKVGIGREAALAKDNTKRNEAREAAIAELRAKLAPGVQVKTRGPKGKVYTVGSCAAIEDGFVIGSDLHGKVVPLRVDTISIVDDAPAA